MGVARGISDRRALATTGHGEDLQMTLAPPFFRAMMDALLHARRTRWARDPRLVANVEVIREPDEFRIVATASVLGGKPS